MEPEKGIEPSSKDWKSLVLPLYYSDIESQHGSNPLLLRSTAACETLHYPRHGLDGGNRTLMYLFRREARHPLRYIEMARLTGFEPVALGVETRNSVH